MSVEYGQFDTGKRYWNQQTEVIMNFLSVGIDKQEPYYPFPSEPAPLLFGAIDEGRMVAAASVAEHIRDGQFLLGLLVVDRNRRREGWGVHSSKL